MKTIVTPTDFSKTSLNAINYAVEIAKKANATLVLFHAYPPPVIVSEVPIIIPTPVETEGDCLTRLEKIKKNILAKPGSKNLRIEIITRCGLVSDEIYLYTLQNPVDLVVMGIQGGGYLKEKLMGSNTTALIGQAKVPVLSVGKTAKFRSIKKIVFANDNEGLKSLTTLLPVKEIAGWFKSHIYILNVMSANSLFIKTNKPFEKRLNTSLKNVKHSFHTTADKTAAQGIARFVKQQKADLVVMVPRKHSLIDQVFNASQTKKMAFHSAVPLLTLGFQQD